MQEVRAAKRYAKSLLDLSTERSCSEECNADMQTITNVCEQNKELLLLLKSPIVKTDKKISILEAIFSKKLSALSLSFLKIITQKKREGYLYDIAQSFQKQYKSYKGIKTALVTSAFPLTSDLKKGIMAIIKGEGKEEISLEEKVDEKIIGGFVIRMDDQQIDTSIKNKLNKLGTMFSDNPYVKEY